MEQMHRRNENLDPALRGNLIRFAALLFKTMSDKYGGATSLNELLMLNYGFVCQSKGKEFCVTQASVDLSITKPTVSRILTGMRAKGFVSEFPHPTDRRRRIFRLTSTYSERGDADIQTLLDWCADPSNGLC